LGQMTSKTRYGSSMVLWVPYLKCLGPEMFWILDFFLNFRMLAWNILGIGPSISTKFIYVSYTS
jgi:hypothetical protein